MAAYEVLLLNTAIPQIQAAQSGDTYLVPRDIAFSAALTLTAGTANGVPYLNASKVLTTGSALTFDGNALNITVSSGNAYSVLTGASTLGAFTNYKNATADHYIGANNNFASLFGGVGGANSLALTTFGNLPIGFGINSSEVMRLTSTGLKAFIAGTNADPVFSYTSDTNTGIFFPAADKLGFTAGGGSDQMVLTSTGLGIGTNNPGQKLDTQAAVTGTYNSTTQQIVARFLNSPADLGSGVNSAFITLQTTPDGGNSNPVARVGVVAESYGSNNGAFVVATRDGSGVSEKARITSGGDLLVGTTDNTTGNKIVTSTTIGFVAGATTPQINYYSSASTIEYVNRDSGGSKTFSWYYQASAAGSPATLSTSGVWTNASDARGKENISDIHYGLDTVLALQPRQYDVKSDGSHAIGFVAQEVLPVVPELVHVTRRTESDEFYGLDYGSMTAVLVKAIQEQQAMINELKAEVAALKGA